jgi:hypothetical protein
MADATRAALAVLVILMVAALAGQGRCKSSVSPSTHFQLLVEEYLS